MYRIVFFKIPFMRGGYRVPATPFGDKPIEHMGNYKVAEIVTDMAFSEQQRQIVLAHDTAVLVDNGAANFCYVAYTSTAATGNYENDSRPAYYWVDDIEFLGVPPAENEPAAIVTISPDVWLTDFFPNTPTIRGRLAQSTKGVKGEPQRPTAQYMWEVGSLKVSDALNGISARVIGTFTSEDGAILCYASEEQTSAGTIETYVRIMSGAAKYKWTHDEVTQENNISCNRLYVVPSVFLSSGGISLIASTTESSIVGFNGVEISVYPIVGVGSILGDGLVHVYDIKGTQESASINGKSWLFTPSRVLEVDYGKGVTITEDQGGTVVTRNQYAASVFIDIGSIGDDGLQILFQMGEEFIDVSDDFLADFAANDAAVRQSQRKELFALQNFVSIVGAAGGAIGGAASGNYFGAVQAIAGGLGQIAGQVADRRAPAQMKGSGGVLSALYSRQSFVLMVSADSYLNGESVADTLSEFGYIFNNEPCVSYSGNEISNDYYRFSVVDVSGMSGGNTAAEEVATAFSNGVKLVGL